MAGGIDLIRNINKETSIVLITGHEEGEIPNHIKESDIDLIIKKPIDANKVVKQVLEVLMERI